MATDDKIEAAFRAGWESSGEGYNGEFPDEGVPWAESAGHEAYQRWVDQSHTPHAPGIESVADCPLCTQYPA